MEGVGLLYETQSDIFSILHPDLRFIPESEAYQRLLATLHRCAEFTFGEYTLHNLTVERTVRQLWGEIREYEPFNSLDTDSPPLISMIFNLAWNPVELVRDYGDGRSFADVSSAITCVTGTPDQAQATTVSQYLQQTWGSSGNHLIALLNRAADLDRSFCSCEYPR